MSSMRFQNSMVVTKHWTKPGDFKGNPTENDFKLVEENLPDDLIDGEILCEAVYLTVDPYMGIPGEHLGKPFGKYKTMFGEAVSKVLKSKNGKYPVGTLVLAPSGWRTHFISNGDQPPLRPIPFDLGQLSPSLALGPLGMPALTAYSGLRMCEPKAGEICVVNGAAGAVGSIVGQLAKAKGLTVIGFAGTDEKVSWCKNDLKFDYVYNYKKITLEDALKESAPNGVDVFYDNVGGDFHHEMISKHMRIRGRTCICGSISNYNNKEPKT
ncbi:unnamed protein product, partial [Didymodactylos carnosus]